MDKNTYVHCNNMILYFSCVHDNQKNLNGVLRKSLILLCILYLKFYNRSKSKSKCLICKGQCSPSAAHLQVPLRLANSLIWEQYSCVLLQICHFKRPLSVTYCCVFLEKRIWFLIKQDLGSSMYRKWFTNLAVCIFVLNIDNIELYR